jgi:CHAT domain-containing protein
MTAAEVIEESRRNIDEWAQTRPPALHFRREYELPDDRDRVPARLSQLLDKVFPTWKTAGFSSFGIAARPDAQLFDSVIFYGRRATLLDRSEESLQTVLESGLSTDLECMARTTQAYGRIQFLLWHLDVGNRPALPISAWQGAGEIASHARRLLRPEAMAEDDWIDAVIRIEFVLGWASLASGNLTNAVQHFLFVVGWYASAEQLGHSELLTRRYNDWLWSLYAILDYGTGQSNEMWRVTASVLVKDLKVGHYRVKPPFAATRSSEGARKLNVQFNMSFAGEEWFRAFSALGDAGAFLDLIVTDRFLHTRLCSLRTSRDIRNELPMVTRPVPEGEEPRGQFQITPLGAIVAPSVEPKERQLATSVEQWHPQEHHSDTIRWISHFQTVHIHGSDELWSWDYQWQTLSPTFEKTLWQTIYDVAFAEALKAAEDAGIRHLIISPDGSLSGIPHHLIRDPQGTRIGDKFAVSYAHNLTGVLTILDAESSNTLGSRFVIVQDPSQNVGMSDWECQTVATLAGSQVTVIKASDATKARIKQECSGAGVLHFTGHAIFEWLHPEDAYLSVAGPEKMALVDLRDLRLQPGALVFLNACDTGRQGAVGLRASSRGIVSSLLEAGAATVICSLWPVDSAAAALVAQWFYQAWVSERKPRLESLQLATRKLRESNRSECEQILKKRIPFGGDKPFEDEFYWGAFVLYGAW